MVVYWVFIILAVLAFYFWVDVTRLLLLCKYLNFNWIMGIPLSESFELCYLCLILLFMPFNVMICYKLLLKYTILLWGKVWKHMGSSLWKIVENHAHRWNFLFQPTCTSVIPNYEPRFLLTRSGSRHILAYETLFGVCVGESLLLCLAKRKPKISLSTLFLQQDKQLHTYHRFLHVSLLEFMEFLSVEFWISQTWWSFWILPSTWVSTNSTKKQLC